MPEPIGAVGSGKTDKQTGSGREALSGFEISGKERVRLDRPKDLSHAVRFAGTYQDFSTFQVNIFNIHVTEF